LEDDWQSSRSVPLTHATVRAALERRGFDAASGEAVGLASAIIAEVQKFAAGQLPAFDASDGPENGPGAYRISYMEGFTWPRYAVWWPWYTPWCVPIWLVAWALLSRWLLRRHRRRLAAFHERSPS
jgi:hypothetical protein